MKKVTFDYDGPEYCCPEKCRAFDPDLDVSRYYTDNDIVYTAMTVRCKNRKMCENITEARMEALNAKQE